MKFLEKYSKWVLVAFGIANFVAFGYLTSSDSNEGFFDRFGRDGESEKPEVPELVGDFTERDGSVQIGPAHEGFNAFCQPPASPDQAVLVAAFNAGPEPVDYSVEVRLADGRGGEIPAVATFTDLRSHEVRYVSPIWSAAIGAIEGCRIVVVEGDGVSLLVHGHPIR